MSVAATDKAVLAATRELNRKWSDTRQHWRDAKSEEFERVHLASLMSEVERAIPIMEELEKAILAARKACE